MGAGMGKAKPEMFFQPLPAFGNAVRCLFTAAAKAANTHGLFHDRLFVRLDPDVAQGCVTVSCHV
ncbi:MAG: hypothetical protein BGO00_09760 [Alphaproteobacteria bacterium 62-8]|nr:MAG: hypothetical protein BGO00_09760 [Alphaproteobacteria bacterium 62-8]